MKNLILTAYLSFLGLSCWGFSFGKMVGDTLAIVQVCDSTASQLPQNIDLKPYCPEVRHQGNLHSCVGWALGYGALTIQRAIQHGCTDTRTITHNASSALFIFNQIPRDEQGRGSKLTDAIAFLETNGDCLARHFDADVDDAKKLPEAELAAAARRFSIAGAMQLFEANDPSQLKISSVKQALAQRKPVAIGMAVRRNFLLLKNARYWHPDLGDTTPAGGHALVVVGYDDQKKAFHLMNSWGKEWGSGGFIWIKYDVFARFCKYACVLQLAEAG